MEDETLMIIKTDHTKVIISESLKDVMKRKPLKLISVQDIVDNCGYSRNTFYYHFIDKQDLTNWIYTNEVLRIIRPITIDHPFDYWGEALEAIYDNRTFYENALSFHGQNSFEDFSLNELSDALLSMIDQYADHRPIEKTSRVFIAKFYSSGISKMTIDWINSGTYEFPEQFRQRLVNVVGEGILTSVEKCIQK
jgi:probable dihydroxyacetone kinase regulator